MIPITTIVVRATPQRVRFDFVELPQVQPDWYRTFRCVFYSLQPWELDATDPHGALVLAVMESQGISSR